MTIGDAITHLSELNSSHKKLYLTLVVQDGKIYVQAGDGRNLAWDVYDGAPTLERHELVDALEEES